MAQAYRQNPETGKWEPYDPKADRKAKAEKAASSVEPTIRRKELEEYAATVDQLADTASSSLEMVLSADLQSFDPNMGEKEWKELRELLIEDLYQTRLYWSDAAGLAACDFYDKIVSAHDATGFYGTAALPDQVSRKICADVVRALAKHLFEGNYQKFIDKVKENAHNGVRRYANDTILMNVKRDGTKGIRYARVPVGIETCAFCIMLASRGFVYYSKESATANGHVHPNCDCKVVPGFEGDVIEGYDPKVYEAIYNAGNQGRGMTDTLNNIRRDILYPVHKDHINEVKRAWYAKNKQQDTQ